MPINTICDRFKLPARLEPLYDENHRYLAGRKEMEPTIELHRFDNVSHNAVFRVHPTNCQSAIHRARLELGGREFIDV